MKDRGRMELLFLTESLFDYLKFSLNLSSFDEEVDKFYS